MKTFTAILMLLIAFALIDATNKIKAAYDERIALKAAHKELVQEKILAQCKLAFPGSDANQKWCVEESNQ